MGAMVSTDRAAPAAGVSIRWRLTLGVLAMLFAVLGTVGVGLFTLVRSQIDQRVTDELTRAADEFRVLASQGVDPDTGQPFTTADDLLQVALARTVLAPSEGILGYVDGQIRWTAPEGVVLRPEQDPGFIAHLNTLRDAPDVRIGALTTPVRQYRYLVAPVSFAATATRGALVRAVDIEAERAVLYEMTLDYVVIAGGSLLLAAGVVAVWGCPLPSRARLERTTG